MKSRLRNSRDDKVWLFFYEVVSVSKKKKKRRFPSPPPTSPAPSGLDVQMSNSAYTPVLRARLGNSYYLQYESSLSPLF